MSFNLPSWTMFWMASFSGAIAAPSRILLVYFLRLSVGWESARVCSRRRKGGGSESEESEEEDAETLSQEGWTQIPLKESSKAMRARMKLARERDAKMKK